jgi:hypothetical protein
LENKHPLPDSFDFGIRYGNMAIYVADIRSNRRVGNDGRIFSPKQFQQIEKFIDRHSDAEVLCVVLTVPVIHLPKYISRIVARITPEQEDFSDRWSTGAHIYDRDRLLKRLHQNQKDNPRQLTILLSGDIHIGCVHRISFENLPMYQIISSPVTHRCNPLVAAGSKLIIRANRKFQTTDGALRGRFELLSDKDSGKNPYGGLNIGIVESSKEYGRTHIRFYLYGHDGKLPVCVYRSRKLEAG